MHVCGVPVGTCVWCIGYVCVWSECREICVYCVECVCAMYVHGVCVVFQLNINPFWDSLYIFLLLLPEYLITQQGLESIVG